MLFCESTRAYPCLRGTLWWADRTTILSVNCKTSRRRCEYTSPEIPLRERKSTVNSALLPGVLQPWHVGDSQEHIRQALPTVPKVTIGPPLDLDTFSVSMPYKSIELLLYFDRTTETLNCVVHEPDVLRGTLLIAGLHYSWNVGSLKGFAPTHFFHTIETMRTVNNLLKQPDMRGISAATLRHISTLCIVEACLGNLDAADTHIKGLFTFMQSRNVSFCSPQSVEEEMANRYMLINTGFVNGLRGRIADSDATYTSSNPYTARSLSPLKVKSEVAYRKIKQGHSEEPGGLDHRLSSLPLIPLFFIMPSSSTVFREIGARPILNMIGEVTELAEARFYPEETVQAKKLWNGGAPTRLFRSFFDAHMESMTPPPENKQEGEPPLLSTWTSLVAVTMLFMHDLLSILNAGEPMEPRLEEYIIRLVMEDVSRNRMSLCRWDRQHRRLWFWKCFISAFSLTAVGALASNPSLTRMRQDFEMCIKEWSKMEGVADWSDARAALVEMAWPTCLLREDEAEGVWKSAMGYKDEVPNGILDGGRTKH
ncbi:hypothetical protein S40293_05019 [Stachybotrys chartarum IBT 40293]|nr:hypothetical protein S40293_05019 [Stachybotrys chartarum IBT 40293]